MRLILLRHGQVPHHRGDVGLTDMGVAQAQAAGAWFARERIKVAALLSGETRRTMDSAAELAVGYRSVPGCPALPDPEVSFGLRNPDLYIGGHRVNLAEGAAAIAAQAPGVDEEQVTASPFFGPLITADERVGYWLAHPNPPGEDAHAVAGRVRALARSLADAYESDATVVAVTHSPVLRAVRLGFENRYTREPPFLHGFALEIPEMGAISFSMFETDTGDIPVTAKPGPGFKETR